MSQARLDFSNGCLVMSTGSEGPSHDPYTYAEYTVRRGDKVVTLHSGMVTWTEVDGFRTRGPKGYAERIFLQEGGLTQRDVVRIFDKHARRGCPEHGWRHVNEVAGYPGESFTTCTACGRILGSSFDIGAVE